MRPDCNGPVSCVRENGFFTCYECGARLLIRSPKHSQFFNHCNRYEPCACSQANDGHCMMCCMDMDTHDLIDEYAVSTIAFRLERDVPFMVG